MEVKKVNEKKVVEVIGNEKLSKSGKMKELFMLGLEVGELAKRLDVRYNFVYNVVSNMINVEGLSDKVGSERKESKKDIVERMMKEGKSCKDICIELKCNNNYVYKLMKEIKDKWSKEVVEVKEGIK